MEGSGDQAEDDGLAELGSNNWGLGLLRQLKFARQSTRGKEEIQSSCIKNKHKGTFTSLAEYQAIHTARFFKP